MNINNMSVYKMHANICKIFTNPTRLMIIDLLRSGKKTVSEMEAALGLRQATLSQHLTILRDREIVLTNRKGHNIYYRIANPKILKACQLMREVLIEQIEQRSNLLTRKEI